MTKGSFYAILLYMFSSRRHFFCIDKAVFFSIAVLGAIFVPAGVLQAKTPDVAIRDSAYQARFLSQSESDPITIEAGKTALVKIQFKNIGTQTWKNEGAHYISAYTMEPRDRSSVFFGSGWKSPRQIGRMAGTIAPGAIGELGIFLHAPNEPGSYVEKFYLAAENHSWVTDGYFFLKITVVSVDVISEKPQEVEESEKANVGLKQKLNGNETEIERKLSDENGMLPETKKISSDTSVNLDYPYIRMPHTAKRIGLNVKDVRAKGGDRIKVVVIYQNTSGAAWKKYHVSAAAPLSLASAESELTFADEEWKNNALVLEKEAAVPADGFVRETFYIRAPKIIGSYLFSAQLYADGTPIDDNISINVHVTENAPLGDDEALPDVPSSPPSYDLLNPKEPRLSEEPRIRVGLANSQNFIQFVSFEDDYRVRDGDVEIGILPQKKIGIVRYADGVYSFESGDISIQTPNRIRLEPVNNPHAVFTLMNYDRLAAWVAPDSFNKYRGAFEYQIGKKDSVLYIISDLLLEDYMKGIAEVSRKAPIEMVKANLAAARTYAFISKGKYAFFDVLGNTYDQLYLGHNAEAALPNVQEAAIATRGIMITYNSEIVTTPYFGNSNGRTKSWTDVWGGKPKPWLVPVKATYDLRDGKRQFGHGVGMSQRDAAIRAEEEGLLWDALIKYYYTGVEVERIYF